MLNKTQITGFSILKDWFNTALGSAVSEEFYVQLKSVQDLVKGDSLLQLGDCGSNSWLEALTFRSKWVTSPLPSKEIHLESSLTQLPFGRNVLDCVLLPLTLESFASDTNLIDEIDRVLKPTGYLVIFSINPWSLWGGAVKLGLLSGFNNETKLRSPFQLNNILNQRGYIQSTLNNFCYIPPVNNPYLLQKLRFLNEVGKMLWPYPSGLYCYIAQKQEYIHPPLIAEAFDPLINEI